MKPRPLTLLLRGMPAPPVPTAMKPRLVLRVPISCDGTASLPPGAYGAWTISYSTIGNHATAEPHYGF